MSTKPAHFLGKREIIQLHKEGWAFQEFGLQLGGCVGCWIERDGERRFVFVADVAEFPEAWADDEPLFDAQLDLPFEVA